MKVTRWFTTEMQKVRHYVPRPPGSALCGVWPYLQSGLIMELPRCKKCSEKLVTLRQRL